MTHALGEGSDIDHTAAVRSTHAAEITNPQFRPAAGKTRALGKAYEIDPAATGILTRLAEVIQ